MYWISETYIWIPFYSILIALIVKKYKKQSIVIILCLVLLVVLTDQISSHLIKNVVKRLRPSHEPNLTNLLHFVNNYHGGTYGFVSSLAANAFGFATFITLLFRKKFKYIAWIMFAWAAVVSYSRIYLGVHYAGDVIAAAILGCFLGWVVIKLYQFSENRLFKT
jgi:undecaprenyl-diphosphatase